MATDLYCSSCGEKKLGTEDRSLRHYLDVVSDFLTHFDSKGYRSLWNLIIRPGFLSEEQLRGSRVIYAKPMSLFISINIVYYFSIALFGANTFTTPLAVHLHANDYYPAYAGSQIDKRLRTEHLDYSVFEKKFDDKVNVLSKTLIFLFIPIYTVIFYGLFFRRRRYIVEHAVVATHLWAFVLLLLATLVPLIAAPLMWWQGASSIAAVFAANDVAISVFLQICLAAYMTLMLRRVYAAPLWYCTAVALVMAWAFFHIVWLYRFLLFVITLHFI